MERIFDAIRRQGGSPELLAVARLPEAPGQAQPPSPHSDSPADRLIKIARGEIASNPPSGGDAKYSLFVLKKLRSQAPVDPTQTAGTPARPTIANAATADEGLQQFLAWSYSGGQITDPKQLEEDQSEDRRNAMVMGLLQIAANAGQAKTIGGVLSGVASGAATGFGAYGAQQQERRKQQQQEFDNRLSRDRLDIDADKTVLDRIRARNEWLEKQRGKTPSLDEVWNEEAKAFGESPEGLMTMSDEDRTKRIAARVKARQQQIASMRGSAGAPGGAATGGGPQSFREPGTNKWYVIEGNKRREVDPPPGV